MMVIKTRIIEIENEKRVAIFFHDHSNIKALIDRIDKCTWSASYKFWHIPYHKDFIKKLNNEFHGNPMFIEEQSYAIKRKLSPQNSSAMDAYVSAMLQRGYSKPTITTYKQHFQRFLSYYPGVGIDNITQEHIRSYIIYLVEVKKYSESAQNNAINAIKCYYRNIHNRAIEDFYIPRPRRSKTNPRILNEKEVILILKQIDNIRDKCMIFLVYSAGLKPSEIVYLKPEHIDSKNMKIRITMPNERKDRFVVLSEKILQYLREYYKQYSPKIWLFETSTGTQYSKRNIQKSFRRAVLKSGITKPATLTILKNSFAVHLLEKGVDIRYIQQLLGHKHSKTTMKYLKVSKRDLDAIKSPLDNLEI